MKRLCSSGLFLLCALGLSACAPNAIFFHESTKIGFTATYNTADSQPVSSHFGFKRRIVAVVPTQERVASEDGDSRNDTNKGESLSLVSKFYVRAGDFNDGVVIRNNFATGEAARLLTRGNGGPSSVRALLHSEAVVVSPAVNMANTSPPAAMIANRVGQMRNKRTNPSDAPPARREISGDPGDRKLREIHPDLPKRSEPPPPARREVTGGSGESPEVHPIAPAASPTPGDKRRTGAPPPAAREIEGSSGSSPRSLNTPH